MRWSGIVQSSHEFGSPSDRKRIARVHEDVALASPIEAVIRPFDALNAATKLVVDEVRAYQPTP